MSQCDGSETVRKGTRWCLLANLFAEWILASQSEHKAASSAQHITDANLLSQESHCILIFAISPLRFRSLTFSVHSSPRPPPPPGATKHSSLSQPANTRPSQKTKPKQNKTKPNKKKKKTETKQCKNKTRRRCSQAFLARQRLKKKIKKKKGNKRVQTWSKKRKQKPRTRRRRQKQPTKGETAQKLK